VRPHVPDLRAAVGGGARLSVVCVHTSRRVAPTQPTSEKSPTNSFWGQRVIHHRLWKRVITHSRLEGSNTVRTADCLETDGRRAPTPPGSVSGRPASRPSRTVGSSSCRTTRPAPAAAAFSARRSRCDLSLHHRPAITAATVMATPSAPAIPATTPADSCEGEPCVDTTRVSASGSETARDGGFGHSCGGMP
jgi:hypothetical protein